MTESQRRIASLTAFLALPLVALMLFIGMPSTGKTAGPPSTMQEAQPAIGLCSLEEIRDVAVLVEIGDEQSCGSGWAFKSDDEVFVWTCAHVLRAARKDTNDFSSLPVKVKAKVTGPDGEGSYYESAAEVLRADIDYDLALLRVTNRLFPAKRPIWDLGPPARLGAKQVIAGCPGGSWQWGTLVFGRNCFMGRYALDKVLDVSNTTATNGSSGSGIFLEDVKLGYPCQGIVIGVYAPAPTLAYYVPARTVREFCRRAKIEWAFNHHLKRPSLEDIRKSASIEFPLPEEK